MIRIIVDTNILVSALLKPDSLPAAVLLVVFSGKVQVCVSEVILAEYEDVLRRPRWKQSPDVIDGTLAFMRSHGHLVKPGAPVYECIDPDDNAFLECAQAADADYLVTGNQRHFPKR